MRLVALAVVTAGLCLCSAMADAAPLGSATDAGDRTFWGYAASIALGWFLVALIRERKR
jgi:hypothetical protein